MQGGAVGQVAHPGREASAIEALTDGTIQRSITGWRSSRPAPAPLGARHPSRPRLHPRSAREDSWPYRGSADVRTRPWASRITTRTHSIGRGVCPARRSTLPGVGKHMPNIVPNQINHGDSPHIKPIRHKSRR